MTRKTAAFAAAVLAGGTVVGKRLAVRKAAPIERGMCFQVASLADVDAGRDFECVVL
jgi:hypothetical protein